MRSTRARASLGCALANAAMVKRTARIRDMLHDTPWDNDNTSRGQPRMKEQSTQTGRRDFLKQASAAALATGFPAVISAQSVTNAIKVGLIGAGGRGSGAARQALTADDYAELTAVAEIDQAPIDRLQTNLKWTEKLAPRVKVEKDHQYIGLDA